MSETFTERLRSLQRDKQTALCVGLDPDPERLPDPLSEMEPLEAAREFCLDIIEATAPFACAFKFNLAFFEALGDGGLRVLREVIGAVPENALTIGDAKRGDIGNSARFYARALFDDLSVDACTVAPYMGRDAVTPFLQRRGTAAFVLARTSNPGADDLQTCTIDGEALYQRVGRLTREWASETPADAGLVVGATRPDAVARLRELCPALPFLIPGVGAQGGSLKSCLELGTTGEGTVIINSSRSIIYASEEGDYAEAAAQEAERLQQEMKYYLAE